jgi:hypothetical protein
LDVIGRMHFIHPSVKDTERFYLRIMLLYRKGAISYDDLKTVKATSTNTAITYSTFQEACQKLGYVDDDTEWDQTLKTATLTRALFARCQPDQQIFFIEGVGGCGKTFLYSNLIA